MVRMRLCENGVTSFCPTVITSSPCTYRLVLPLLQPCEGGGCGAGMLGLHLEGTGLYWHNITWQPIEMFVLKFCVRSVYFRSQVRSTSERMAERAIPSECFIIRLLWVSTSYNIVCYSECSLTLS